MIKLDLNALYDEIRKEQDKQKKKDIKTLYRMFDAGFTKEEIKTCGELLANEERSNEVLFPYPL